MQVLLHFVRFVSCVSFCFVFSLTFLNARRESGRTYPAWENYWISVRVHLGTGRELKLLFDMSYRERRRIRRRIAKSMPKRVVLAYVIHYPAILFLRIPTRFGIVTNLNKFEPDFGLVANDDDCRAMNPTNVAANRGERRSTTAI